MHMLTLSNSWLSEKRFVKAYEKEVKEDMANITSTNWNGHRYRCATNTLHP